MSILDVFTKPEENSDRIRVAMENSALNEELGYMQHEIRDLQESLLRVSDAFDNIGWSPLPEDEVNEIPLKTVKEVAKIARAMYAMNPFIKRGVKARHSYIWGKGVTFDGVDDIGDQLDEYRRKMFSPQAYEELEAVLATDGNAFTALSVQTGDDEESPFRVPLDDITGCVTNPLDKEEVWYYKRETTVEKTNSQTGVVTKNTVIAYYASLTYYTQLKKKNKPLARRWNKIGVEQNFVIQHTAVNKQVGWRWGVPDIMPVIFWAKAYKEYLEDNANLVKAYNRLAWQVKSPTAGGAAAAGASVMRPPTRDPRTGELSNVGGSAIMGSGNELAPIAANGSTVDFSKGSALASAIAAGLEVSLVVILSDSGSSNKAAETSLDLPTLKAMEARQQLHSERFLEIFEFWGADITPPRESLTTPNTPVKAVKAKTKDISEAVAEEQGTGSGVTYAIVTWPQIETDTTKDRITALGTSVELGIIFKQEARKEALEVFGIAPYKPWDDLPTMADDPAAAEQQAITEKNQQMEFQNQVEITKQTAIAKQGVSGGVSAKGGSQTASNSSRTARAKDTNNS